MINDNGLARAQEAYDNQLPPEHDDKCERCENETNSDDLNEVKVNNTYKYICQSCYEHLMENGFLNRED